MKTTIYILKLEQGKYYVGKTNDIKFRLDKHFNYFGSYWTVKYRPISVFAKYENCDCFDEDKHTIKMMAEFGIENVRGGSFTQINLPQDELNIINKMINGACDNCFKCHFAGHFANKCPYDTISNYEFALLRDKIIKCCSEINPDDEYIDINTLSKILREVDRVIFDTFSSEIINKLCRVIDNSNIKGIHTVIINSKVHYVDFSIGMSVLIDRQPRI